MMAIVVDMSDDQSKYSTRYIRDDMGDLPTRRRYIRDDTGDLRCVRPMIRDTDTGDDRIGSSLIN
jgi:hypothetical protein